MLMKLKSILKAVWKPIRFLLLKIKAFFSWFLVGNQKKQENATKLRAFLEKHTVLYHIVLSLVVCFIIEWMSRHSFLEACSFVTGHFGPYLFNSFIIFAFYSLAWLVTRRIFVRVFITGFFLVMGVVNSIILANRVTPFGFTDLNMVGDLLTMQNSKYFSAQEALLVIIALVIFLLFLVHIFNSSYRVNVKHKIYLRAIPVVLLLASLYPAAYVLQHTGVLASYFGNLAQGYLDYGYLYGFSTSMLDRGMSMPIGYSDIVVDRIVESDDTGETTLDAEDGPNVIVVLLESFFDPSEVSYIETSSDPIPYFHYLQENYSTGHLTVPVVGAGTCNTEFEVLTGMSCQFFGPGEYPQKTILKKSSCESIAGVLSDVGYGTHVVHNNGGNFYSRKNAFSQMGFDTFISKEMLDITEYTPLGSWPTDDILIEATSDSLDTTEGADLVYTITVGTHGAYPDYEVIENPAIKVTAEGQDEGTNYQWEYYINQLHTMDQWIEDYIEMLSERDEDTLVVMFGDHLPTMGLTDEDVEQGDIFQTEYITWNNFGMSKEDADLTSYQLMSEYLGRIGVHDGTIVTYNQKEMSQNVPAGSIRYMAGLEQLQYDLLYGKRYAYNGEDLYPATDIEMGVKDVVIDRMYAFGGKVYIYGQNFTNWSKVYVNGEKVATAYKSGQVLTISLDKVQNGDSIVVNQLGSSETIFRSSNEMIFHDASYEEAEDEAPASTEDPDTEATEASEAEQQIETENALDEEEEIEEGETTLD